MISKSCSLYIIQMGCWDLISLYDVERLQVLEVIDRRRRPTCFFLQKNIKKEKTLSSSQRFFEWYILHCLSLVYLWSTIFSHYRLPNSNGRLKYPRDFKTLNSKRAKLLVEMHQSWFITRSEALFGSLYETAIGNGMGAIRPQTRRRTITC